MLESHVGPFYYLHCTDVEFACLYVKLIIKKLQTGSILLVNCYNVAQIIAIRAQFVHFSVFCTRACKFDSTEYLCTALQNSNRCAVLHNS